MGKNLIYFILLGLMLSESLSSKLTATLNEKTNTNHGYESSVRALIARIIEDKQDPDNFIIKVTDKLDNEEKDTFELEMVENQTKLKISANSGVAAAWGFNYYLKYFSKSSMYWSGKNINLSPDKLPIVKKKVKITAKDYFRFYQNVCTYSYSFVWWDWKRWEYEIDWMVLNGINIVYAQTAAEYAWIKVFGDMGFTEKEINDFFTGPAYLAWFRMGNIKNFGGYLPKSWHNDQYNLLKKQIARYQELGIKYVLPAFSGFVPDQIIRLFPNKNFTAASAWNGFPCTQSCNYMVSPLDPLFQTIGQAYIKEIISNFGTNHFYSADVFNENTPKSTDLDYLANVNAAIYQSIIDVDIKGSLLMQAWLFYFEKSFWTNERVKAFLSKIPIGRLLLLDLYSESYPEYQNLESYYGHYFIWNMLQDFGGANGMFGPLSKINEGPEIARNFPNSSMVGVGITMEGINQNEILYEFVLEKSWKGTLSDFELNEWIKDFTIRRYSKLEHQTVTNEFQEVWETITDVIYNTSAHAATDQRPVFTRRPSFNLVMNNVGNIDKFYSAWDKLISISNQYQNRDLLNYDLVDITKEALTNMFEKQYLILVDAWHKNDLYLFNDKASFLIDLLSDIEKILATDSRFLLGKWIHDAKLKGTNLEEREMYEWNARTQITIWGRNDTQGLFDYACKAWSGLVQDYYLPRWKLFFAMAEEAMLEGIDIDQDKLNKKLLLNAELPFISTRSIYPTTTIGNSFEIAKELNLKYRF